MDFGAKLKVVDLEVLSRPMAKFPGNFSDIIKTHSRPAQADRVEPYDSILGKKATKKMLGARGVDAPVVGENQNGGAFKHGLQVSRRGDNSVRPFDQW